MVQVRLDNISSSETISNQNGQDLISSCEYSILMEKQQGCQKLEYSLEMEKQQGCQKLPRVLLRTPPFLSNDTVSSNTMTRSFSLLLISTKAPCRMGIRRTYFWQKNMDSQKWGRSCLSLCYRSFDVLGSLMSDMEYLSHSWSPAASDFLHTSSSNVRYHVILSIVRPHPPILSELQQKVFILWQKIWKKRISIRFKCFKLGILTHVVLTKVHFSFCNYCYICLMVDW